MPRAGTFTTAMSELAEDDQDMTIADLLLGGECDMQLRGCSVLPGDEDTFNLNMGGHGAHTAEGP